MINQILSFLISTISTFVVMSTIIEIKKNYKNYKNYKVTYKLIHIGIYRFYHKQPFAYVLYKRLPHINRYHIDGKIYYLPDNDTIQQLLDEDSKCVGIKLYSDVYDPFGILLKPETFTQWFDLYSVYWYFKIKKLMDRRGYTLDYQWTRYHNQKKEFKFLR